MPSFLDRYDDMHGDILVEGADLPKGSGYASKDELFNDLANVLASRLDTEGIGLVAYVEHMDTVGEEGVHVNEQAFERPFEGRVWVSQMAPLFVLGQRVALMGNGTDTEPLLVDGMPVDSVHCAFDAEGFVLEYKDGWGLRNAVVSASGEVTYSGLDTH